MGTIVINAGYGGFSLSREAVLRARELSCNPAWGGPCIKGDKYPDGAGVPHDYGYTDDDVPRDDDTLVRVVEERGRRANGPCAWLRVVELPTGTAYRIEEDDGLESVVTISDDWRIAK